MDETALLSEVRRVVADVVGANRLSADAGADTPLGDGGLWLDSLETLEVVLACESRFAIIFLPGEDLVEGGLETLGALTELIRRRRAGR